VAHARQSRPCRANRAFCSQNCAPTAERLQERQRQCRPALFSATISVAEQAPGRFWGPGAGGQRPVPGTPPWALWWPWKAREANKREGDLSSQRAPWSTGVPLADCRPELLVVTSASGPTYNVAVSGPVEQRVPRYGLTCRTQRVPEYPLIEILSCRGSDRAHQRCADLRLIIGPQCSELCEVRGSGSRALLQ